MAQILSEIAGTVWKVLVSENEEVTADQEIIIIESMKMEIPVVAESAGKITKLLVNEEDFVNAGDILAEIE